jgi:hypothetical protein
VYAVALSPDDTVVASGSKDATVRLWDAATGRMLRCLTGHQGEVTAFAFRPDGRVVASGSHDGTARLWDVATGKEQGRFEQNVAAVESLAFTPDGRRLIIGRTRAAALLWDVATGKVVRKVAEPIPGSAQSALSPDGLMVAHAGPFGISLHDRRTGKSRWFCPDPFGPAASRAENGQPLPPEQPREASAVAFSPTGRMLASADGNAQTVTLWEVATGRGRVQFLGHSGPVNTVAFATDGTRVVSGSGDTTVLIWDVFQTADAGTIRTAGLMPAELDLLWYDLTQASSRQAHRALCKLAAAPAAAVALLRKRLPPVAPPDPRHLNSLIADLDHERYAKRSKATAELEALGELAEPALRQVLRDKPSLEVRRRVEKLLDRLVSEQAPYRLQTLRALELLEHLATPEARQVLKEIAGGADGALGTREAKAALKRLERRPVVGRDRAP